MIKPVYAICEQQRCRSACASTQSDQRLLLFAAWIISYLYFLQPKQVFLWCCSFCSYFSEPAGYLQTPTKYYSCSFCNKLFTRSNHVRAHERIHTGEKPYGCEICGKLFREKGSLTSHKRIHTGDKPYSCQLCGKSFTTNSNMRTHHITHH